MTAHLDETTLELALSGELEGRARATVEAHLAACAECADRLAAVGREERRLFGLLEGLDHEPPPLDWAAVRAAEPRPEPTARPARSLMAAGLAFLLVGAAVLAAIPGTPVRQWLEAALDDHAPPDRPAAVEGARSGISVLPGEIFEVAFAARQHAGSIRVSFVAGAALELTVTGDPVELESSADRLAVGNAGSSAGYELEVPRALRTFRVTVAGETVLEKSGGTIRVSAARDAEGAYVVDLSAEGG